MWPPNNLGGDLTSDLKFMAQLTYATMSVSIFWPSFKFDKKKEKRDVPLLELSALPQLKIGLM